MVLPLNIEVKEEEKFVVQRVRTHKGVPTDSVYGRSVFYLNASGQ